MGWRDAAPGRQGAGVAIYRDVAVVVEIHDAIRSHNAWRFPARLWQCPAPWTIYSVTSGDCG
jgi:hypothetical protein